MPNCAARTGRERDRLSTLAGAPHQLPADWARQRTVAPENQHWSALAPTIAGAGLGVAAVSVLA
jgi:hypothetical protein